MASAEEAFFEAISKGDLPAVHSLLDARSVSLPALRDQNRYTPLHFACLSGNEVLVEYLMTHMETHHSREELTEWVNIPNNEDFTPVCFAVFRGNLVICTQRLIALLERAGARLKLDNARKLELMHVAAQGNQPAVIAFLLEKGFDVNPKDVKGGTPLHWAAFMGCELAASLLLAMHATVNEQDLEGQTPLHLAALAGNVKIVRCLLVKGADRSVKVRGRQTSLGRTALAVAKDRKHEALYSMLQEPGMFASCALRPPLRPYRRAYFTMFAYLVLFTAGNVFNIFLSLKGQIHVGVSSPFRWAYLMSCLLSIILWAVVSLRDPGFMPRSTIPLTTLYATSRMEDVCPDCMSLRPPRARHCQCCSRCVQKFDHHCPWLSNCVGARNLGWFYCFLVTTTAALGLSAYMNLAAVFNGGEGALVSVNVFYLRIAAATLFVLSVFFGVPLAFLLLVQTQNFLLNRTTNERFARHPVRSSGSFADSMSSAQRIDRSNPCGNCYRMCCNASDSLREGYDALQSQ